ncbi:MAG: hypothetical protein ACKVTZ_17245 [Bacteroidia bacterium]
MKKHILFLFLSFLFAHTNTAFSQNEVLNKKGVSLNLLFGARLNPISYAWVRTVLPTNAIALKPSLGAELNINQLHTAIVLRKQYWIMPAALPKYSVAGFMDDTFLGINHTFRHDKKLRIRAGLDFFWSVGSYEYTADNSANGGKSSTFKKGLSPYIAFPFQWIEIELRPEWIFWDISGIYEAYHYGININYRFAYYSMNKK